MSLNRYEQALFDYLRDHPEEHRHWQSKVAAQVGRGERRAALVAEDLWEYCRERGAHTQPFRDWAAGGGVPRSSLLNLAEYLIRIWGPPVVAKVRPPPGG